MNEKCFCHLNGYEVKDAKARAQISELQNYITPEMFGAVGDGVTDDTIAIQNAIKKAQSNTTLYLLNKYLVSSDIKIDNQIVIKGMNKQLSTIILTNNAKLHIAPSIKEWVYEVYLSEFNIKAEDSDYCILCENMSQAFFTNLYLEKAKISNIKCSNASIVYFDRVYSYYSINALEISGNNINLQECNFWENENAIKTIGSVTNFNIITSWIENFSNFIKDSDDESHLKFYITNSHIMSDRETTKICDVSENNSSGSFEIHFVNSRLNFPITKTPLFVTNTNVFRVFLTESYVYNLASEYLIDNTLSTINPQNCMYNFTNSVISKPIITKPLQAICGGVTAFPGSTPSLEYGVKIGSTMPYGVSLNLPDGYLQYDPMGSLVLRVDGKNRGIPLKSTSFIENADNTTISDLADKFNELLNVLRTECKILQ